jgi:hypothetical protein
MLLLARPMLLLLLARARRLRRCCACGPARPQHRLQRCRWVLLRLAARLGALRAPPAGAGSG